MSGARRERRSGTTRKGIPWLRTLLAEAATAAARTKGTALSARYRRVAARRGRKKAIGAVAHALLIIAYHILAEGTCYRERGDPDADPPDRIALQRRLVRRLERLGHQVTLAPHRCLIPGNFHGSAPRPRCRDTATITRSPNDKSIFSRLPGPRGHGAWY